MVPQRLSLPNDNLSSNEPTSAHEIETQLLNAILELCIVRSIVTDYKCVSGLINGP